MPDDSPNWYMAINRIIYSFHMPLFMFASGFVYYETKKTIKYKDFVWNKVKRLFIPYLGVSILIIIIKLIAKGRMNVENPVSLSSFYEIFYLPSAGYFLWFIYVLLMIFLVIPFFDTRKKINILLIVSLIILLTPITITDLFCLEQFKNHLFYFVLGCFMSLNKETYLKWNKNLSFLFVLVFVGLFLLKNNISIPVMQLTSQLLLAVLGIFITLIVSTIVEQKTERVKHLFVKIAIYSYTIYLFHTTFQGFAKSILSRIYISESTVFFVAKAFVVILSGIIGPILLYMIYMKIKNTHKQLSGRKSKPDAS